MSTYAPDALVVQAAHWPDGFVFRVLGQVGEVVTAQPLDPGSLFPAVEPFSFRDADGVLVETVRQLDPVELWAPRLAPFEGA